MAEKHQKKKKGSALKILLVVLLLLVLTVGAAGVFAYNEINGNGGKPGAEVTVSIPQGSGVAAIAKELKEAGVIRSAYLFRWYVGHKGAAGKLQYGDFTLQTGGYSYDGLITELSAYAKADSVRLTFPEGTTAIAIARKMEEAGLCTAEEFLEEANTGDFSEYTFWQYVPDDAPDRFMKCEGYLFPDTYEFLTDDTVHHYVATFYAHFDKQFTDEMYRELEKQELTLPEVITLASFVQEEAGNDQDSNVAQVFRNRLAEGSPYPKLQSNTSSYVQSDEDNNYLWNWVAPYYGGWGRISPRTSGMPTIPTPAPACPPGPSRTRALPRSRLLWHLSVMRKSGTAISLLRTFPATTITPRPMLNIRPTAGKRLKSIRV